MKMACRDDQREFLKGVGVNCELSRESVESIAAALDLVTVEMTIEYCEVNSAPRVRKAQFVDHEDVVSLVVMT